MPFRPLTPEEETKLGVNKTQQYPTTTPTGINLRNDQPGWAERNAPTVGAVALPTIGAFGSGGTSIPVSGALSGAGYAGGTGVSNILKTIRETNNAGGLPALIKGLREDPKAFEDIMSQTVKAPVRWGNEITKAEVGGTETAISSMIFGKLLNTLAKPFYGKTGKLGGITPDQLSKSAEDIKNTVYGPEIGKIIDQLKNTKVNTSGILDRLSVIRNEAVDSGDQAAFRAVDAVLNRIKPQKSVLEDEIINLVTSQAKKLGIKNADEIFSNSSITNDSEKLIREAFQTKRAFGKDILKPTSGEVRLTLGNKSAETSLAKAIGGDEMQKLIIEEAKKIGISNAPEVFKKYATLTNVANQLKTQPYKGYQLGYILPLLISAFTGNNPLLTAGGAAIGAASMPYTRTLIPQLIGRLIEKGSLPLIAAEANKINQNQRGSW